jgi:hypothetical protein
MENLKTILKQRRVWASIFALISIGMRAFAPDLEFDEERATELTLLLIQTLSDIGMVFLPLWSFFRPKK